MRRVADAATGYETFPTTVEAIVTDDPSQNPDADPAAEPRPASSTGAPPSVQPYTDPYTDPVEERGAQFAREADEDRDDGTQRPATGGDPSGGDLSPDFLAPYQPS